MKTLIAPLFVALYLILHSTELIQAQATVVVAPPDIVISENYPISLIRLNDVNDSLYGRMVFSIAERRQFFTRDVVCKKFCDENKYSGYAGNNGKNPVATLACNYYTTLYDSSQQFKQYNLNWGLDGYVLTNMPGELKLTVEDKRICGEGAISRIFSAVNANNQTLRDTQIIWFVDCVRKEPSNLSCQSEIKFLLGSTGIATIEPSLMLVGTGYCYEFFTVEIRDWITNALIDRDSQLDGKQIDCRDIGRTLKVTVIDQRTGESCWGRMIIEDKLPPVITCPPDLTLICGANTKPAHTGIASWQENCGSIVLTFKDFILYGNCDSVYESIIRRTWTAKDNSNNSSNCLQLIQVNHVDTNDIVFPPDYDDIDQPSLLCGEWMNPDINVNSSFIDHPSCVDGFLLDSNYWYAHPNEPDIYPNKRRPRILGWNIITDTSKHSYGFPNPDDIYYPAHKDWSLAYPDCWGAEKEIMWKGTGFPNTAKCSDYGVNYRDSIVHHSTTNCAQSYFSCYEIYRIWQVLDWCSSTYKTDTQIIKVSDREGPEILYPDTLILGTESHSCLGRWEVSPAWLFDNCSNEIHYTIQVDSGVILGNEVSGYVVVNMPRGIQNAYIIAKDCCGNTTQNHIVLNVIDNTPPNLICDRDISISVSDNQTQGNNFATLFGYEVADTTNSCGKIYLKVIRMVNLKGTNNGSTTNQDDNGNNCANWNGDDDPNINGNQIYFDDSTNFCCSDIGETILVVVRAFDTLVGSGPLSPSRMSKGGDLYNHFSDCMVSVTVQDKSIPTLVAPPDIVVSCEFPINMNALTDRYDATFGRILTDLPDRKKTVTNDKVCFNYCVQNDTTGYPGNPPNPPPPNPPASNRACEYYRTLFDTMHPDRFYELTWGFDGYALSACEADVSISVDDQRRCGQGKINRIITTSNSDGVKVTTTQTIWVVGCDNQDPSIQIQFGNLANSDTSFSDIELKAILSDDCQNENEIILSYEIDEYNDASGKYVGGFDHKVGPLSLKNYLSGLVPLFHDNIRAFDSNHPANASGRYPVGIHKIKWTAEDICGRVRMATQLFEIPKVVGTNDLISDSQLILIPNPSSGDFQINSRKTIDRIRIRNISGAVYGEYFLPDHGRLKLIAIPQGVYLVTAFNKNELIGIKKLVIIR